MIGFVQNWFAQHRANPIGIDFGSDCLRLAQVQEADGEHRLIAAASADLPHHIRQDKSARITFFADAVRDLVERGSFHGRQAVLALPACILHIQHLRLPRSDDASIKASLPWELRGKLPIDPSHCLLRHIIAGEVYQDSEPKHEVIAMAAARELVDQLLAAAARAKLEVAGMNVEPQALVDCFGHVYRRRDDADVVTGFLDIGCSASRAVVAKGNRILFSRAIPVGGDQFNQAVAERLKIGFEEAKTLRIKLCDAQPALDERRQMQDAAPESSQDRGVFVPSESVGSAEAAAVADACAAPLEKLVDELTLCRRYCEATFPDSPLQRLVFVGGEARHRSLCQHIARAMGVVAQVGDPLVRMGRNSDIGIESGIDRRRPQPSWAVAIGLSMGPLKKPKAVAKR